MSFSGPKPPTIRQDSAQSTNWASVISSFREAGNFSLTCCLVIMSDLPVC